MMRKVLSRIKYALVVCCLLLACCQKAEVEPQVVSILHLKQMYRGLPLTLKDNIEIEGRLTACNQLHGLRGVIVVDDGTAAIEIKVPYEYKAFELAMGHSVRVSCQELTLGGYGGIVELGRESTNPKYQVGSLSSEQVDRIISLDGVATIELEQIEVPQVLVRDLGPESISRYVKIEKLKVLPTAGQVSWCSDADGVVNTCAIDDNGDTIALRVYDYCEFAPGLLPSAPIDAEGIVGYFNGYQLRLLRYNYSQY